MKITYITPRYGVEVLGGAEYAARMLAERLVTQLGFEVEVLTSCALDSTTWQNHYSAGTDEINGVDVSRFETAEPRHAKFDSYSQKALAHPQLTSLEDAEFWIDKQGPLAPKLLDALSESDADLFAFYPYLYYPTVRGLPLVAKKSIMHPAAHDEAPIRLPVFAPLFAMTQGFVFQTDGERRLVESLFEVADTPQLSLGLGVDPEPGEEADFRSSFDLNDTPYVLCLGRVDNGKGATLLATYFAEYKKRYPGPLKLVYCGPVIDEIERHDDILVLGSVSDEHKWGALRGAEVLISPSAFEAFSLVLIEAWSVQTPVLVNARCIATHEHAQRSAGGLWFDGYVSFEASLHRMLTDSVVSERLAENGSRYVEGRFRWPALIERYGQFLEHMASRF